MSVTKDQIIEAVAAMSIMDIIELITAMEKKFGVSATSNINHVNNNSSQTEVNEDVEEKTEFNLTLKAIGNNKIAVIKLVRSAIGLGLKEAKNLVESAPIILKESISKSEAENLGKSLEEIGAEIEIN